MDAGLSHGANHTLYHARTLPQRRPRLQLHRLPGASRQEAWSTTTTTTTTKATKPAFRISHGALEQATRRCVPTEHA
jgi:hypothetical protein